jgi:transposase InsO family protein
MVHGLFEIYYIEKFYEECVLGKHLRHSFQKKAEYQITDHLALIHTDIYGLITLESFSGKKYFITFIDDYSIKTWVYFLKEKSEALKLFKKFKVMVEKATDKIFRTLRSDQGGEYNSTEFARYCTEHGIRRFLVVPYSPQ